MDEPATTGSKCLSAVSGYLGFPLDQVNFVTCQLFALAAAFWFRLYLRPTRTDPLVRHAVATLLGIAFLVFCFGWYSAHIVIIVVINYLIIIKADISDVHSCSLVMSMGYLTACQLSRVFIFNYGILSTDFSGPLMIVTQKITTLAFQLHDGMCKKPEQLSREQKHLAINGRPSLMEYLSYNLNFLSVLVGPCNNFNEYTDFIEGKHTPTCSGNPGFNVSPLRAVGCKLLVCCCCVLTFLTVTRSLPINYNVDAHFVANAHFLTRIIYAFFSIQAARPKFYFAWTLADAVNNAAGYGFQGMDESGNPLWNLISNVNVVGIETATSFKTFIDNWNIRTGIWLKMVCYDRAPKHRLPLTFLLSAMWHGVYPGYYFTFLTAIPITLAARAIRRCVRHYFLGSPALKRGYDTLTWAATQLAVCYTVMPFLLLKVDQTIIYYRSMYFHMHIISILATVALLWKHKLQEPSASSTKAAPIWSSSSRAPCSAEGLRPLHSNDEKKLE